jgi:xyloglucan-specific endo-beta-1,4-glucanase
MKAFSLLAVAPLALAQTLCDQFSYTSTDSYYANNNKWGSALGAGQQCTHIDSVSDDGISWRVDWSWSGNDAMVKSYPYAGRMLAEKKLVSHIGSIRTQADWGYSGDAIRANVAYDMFTAADPAHETSSGDYEVMVWLANYGDLWPVGRSVGRVEMEGAQWTLWDGFNGDMHVYTFVADAAQHSVDFDAKRFFDYLRDNKGFPVDSQYMTGAFFSLSSSICLCSQFVRG